MICSWEKRIHEIKRCEDEYQCSSNTALFPWIYSKAFASWCKSDCPALLLWSPAQPALLCNPAWFPCRDGLPVAFHLQCLQWITPYTVVHTKHRCKWALQKYKNKALGEGDSKMVQWWLSMLSVHEMEGSGEGDLEEWAGAPHMPAFCCRPHLERIYLNSNTNCHVPLPSLNS